MDTFYITILILLYSRNVLASGLLGPDLEEGPVDQKVLSGDRVVFTCDLTDDNDRTVLWYSAQTQSYITRNDEVRNPMLRDRFTILVNHTTQTYTLVIEDVREIDAGSYECSFLIGLRAKTLGTAHLVVIPAPASKPDCDITYVPDRATTLQGQVVDVSCSWENSHSNVIATLFHNDSRLIPVVSLNDRIVSRVDLGDQGINDVFRCDIAAPELEWKSSCSIKAQANPSLKVGINPQVSRLTSDSAVSLDCYGQTDGAIPDYSWIIPSNESYHVSEVFNSEKNFTSIKLDGLRSDKMTVVVECRVSNKKGEMASSIAVVDVQPSYHPLKSSRIVISLLAGLMVLLLFVILISCFVCSSKKRSSKSYSRQSLLSKKKGSSASTVYDTVAKYYQDGHLSLNLDSPPSSPPAVADRSPAVGDQAASSHKRTSSFRSALYTKPMNLPKKLSRSNKSAKTQPVKTTRSLSLSTPSGSDSNVLYENLPRTGSMSSLYSRLSTGSGTSMASLNESSPRGFDAAATDNDYEPILKHSYIGLLKTNRFTEDECDEDVQDHQDIDDTATSSKRKAKSKPLQYVELDLQEKSSKRKSKKKPKVKWADSGVVYTELNI